MNHLLVYSTRNMPQAFDDSHVLSYGDSELERHVGDAPRLPGPFSMGSISMGPSSISLLSSKYVAKAYPGGRGVEDALKAMEMARCLGIRVPEAKRILNSEMSTYVIMERVDGITLEEAWPKLNCLISLRLALQLRRFIHSLRSVTSSTAGSPATGACKSFWLEDRYFLPQNSSPADLHSFITFWARFKNPRVAIQEAAQGQSYGPISSSKTAMYIPRTTTPFVFTHHDLAPRNLILDRHGDLWLVDWDLAGCYPVYFEYAAMHNFIPWAWSWFVTKKWELFTWIAAGRWEKERRLLEIIRSRFTRFPVCRRYTLLRHGGPTGRPVDAD